MMHKKLPFFFLLFHFGLLNFEKLNFLAKLNIDHFDIFVSNIIIIFILITSLIKFGLISNRPIFYFFNETFILKIFVTLFFDMM